MDGPSKELLVSITIPSYNSRVAVADRDQVLTEVVKLSQYESDDSKISFWSSCETF
jgi:hypothetical protein